MLQDLNELIKACDSFVTFKRSQDALIKRLENFTYPKPLLDIVLVLEAVDEITHTAIQRIQLPSWIKVVVVPDAKGLTTKSRTMNYALEKLGRWDAYNVTEDADLGVRFASHL